MENLLDEAYERFLSKKDGVAKQRKRSKQDYKDDQLLEVLGLVLPPIPFNNTCCPALPTHWTVIFCEYGIRLLSFLRTRVYIILLFSLLAFMLLLVVQGDENTALHSDQDSDNEMDDCEANPLMVPLAEDAPTQEEIAAKWFSQDIFEEKEEGDEQDKVSKPLMLGNDDSEDEMQVDLPSKLPKASAKKMEVDAPGQSIHPKKANKVDDGFEVVPAPDTDSSDSSSDESDNDDTIETKAEILACAKKMLHKKQRENLIDDAYNKYMFHDDGLPKWFLDEEKKHRVPVKPVTKEEIDEMKRQFREINARPAKKVAEAKARKKRAAYKKLEKVRKKANTISDQADISDRSKGRMIEQLYKKATVTKKPQKEYVVAKKGVQVKGGKGKVVVDRRMKKDARKKGMSKDKKGGKQKGKGSTGKGKGSFNKAKKK